MEKLIHKKLPVFGLLLIASCLTIVSSGQYYSTCTCVSGNPPGYCYTDKNGNLKCHKYHISTNNGGGNDYNGPCACDPKNKATVTVEFSADDEPSSGIYPNPAMSSARIHIVVHEPQRILVKIFDLSGRVLTTLADDVFEAGEHQIQWDLKNANTGTYFLWLQTSEGVQTKKLLVVK